MTAATAQSYVDRWRERERARKIHDWRLTLLPAAIEFMGHRGRAVQVCKALCDRQKAYFPEVIVSSYQLAEELGMDRRNVQRELRLLIRAGLLAVVVGGGRLAAPRGTTGRADIFRVGPRVSPQIVDVVNSVTQDAVSAPQTASHRTLYPPSGRSPNSVIQDAPTPFGVLRTPSGDTGERTVALTGDPPPNQPLPATVTTHRIRDLLERFNPVKYGSHVG